MEIELEAAAAPDRMLFGMVQLASFGEHERDELWTSTFTVDTDPRGRDDDEDEAAVIRRQVQLLDWDHVIETKRPMTLIPVSSMERALEIETKIWVVERAVAQERARLRREKAKARAAEKRAAERRKFEIVGAG